MSANGDDDDASTLNKFGPDSDIVDEDGPSLDSPPQRPTAFENSLPAVATDQEAIEEYEAMRASQSSQNEPADASAAADQRHWVRGNSSIYVDAFNLALDTVLEDEAHLFDAKEMCVFEQWRALSYEAQYL
jgi:Fanconi-associated nuclease 1